MTTWLRHLIHTSQHKVDYIYSSQLICILKQSTNTALVMTSNSPGNCKDLATQLSTIIYFIGLSLINWHNFENNKSQFWDFHEHNLRVIYTNILQKDWPSVITCNVNLLVTPHGYTHMYTHDLHAHITSAQLFKF